MYPTLYHFFFDVFGAKIGFLKAIPMFGFWVGISFLVANWIAVKELKRRESLGLISAQKKTITIGEPATITDYIGQGVLGFLLGFKIIYIFFNSEVTENFPSFIMSTKGSLFGGILIAAVMIGWKYFESKKNALPTPEKKEIDYHPYQHMGNITMISVVFGILGAVLFGFLEKPGELWADFQKPEGTISDLYGGLTVYGGVLLAAGANIYYFWKNKLNLVQFLDALGPVVLLAYAIGRIGCHMAGDGDWGIENLEPKPEWMSFLPDWMWAYDYPNNVNGEGILMDNCLYRETFANGDINNQYCYKLANPVYPTPVYETIMGIILFIGLWSIRKIVKIPLLIFSLYILATGIERLLIEQIRVNVGHDTGFTQAELISIGLIVLGIGLAIFSYTKLRTKNSELKTPENG